MIKGEGVHKNIKSIFFLPLLVALSSCYSSFYLDLLQEYPLVLTREIKRLEVKLSPSLLSSNYKIDNRDALIFLPTLQ